jgi:hypothetical protein
MSDITPGSPVYSRNLTRKEIDERKNDLIAKLTERRDAMVRVAEAQKSLKVAKGSLDMCEQQIDTLHLEITVGKAVVPRQLTIDDVPVLADDDGEAVDDDRPEASPAEGKPAKKKRAARRSAAAASN